MLQLQEEHRAAAGPQVARGRGRLELLLHPPLLLLGLFLLEPLLPRSLRLCGALLLGLGLLAPRPLVLGSLIRRTTIALLIDPGRRLAVPCELADAPLRRGAAWPRVHRHARSLRWLTRHLVSAYALRARVRLLPGRPGECAVAGERVRGFHLLFRGLTIAVPFPDRPKPRLQL